MDGSIYTPNVPMIKIDDNFKNSLGPLKKWIYLLLLLILTYSVVHEIGFVVYLYLKGYTGIPIPSFITWYMLLGVFLAFTCLWGLDMMRRGHPKIKKGLTLIYAAMILSFLNFGIFISSCTLLTASIILKALLVGGAWYLYHHGTFNIALKQVK